MAATMTLMPHPGRLTPTAAILMLLLNPSAPVLAGPLPSGPPGVDLTTLDTAAAQRAPWLAQLANRGHLSRAYALQLAWRQEVLRLDRYWHQLPDPARTIISDEKDRRKRQRRKVLEQLTRAQAVLGSLPAEFSVDIAPLLAADFVSGDAAEQAGLTALRDALLRGTHTVHFQWDSGQLLIYLRINGVVLAIGR